MQEVLHPNKLKMLLAMAGLSQRETAHESGIPEGTLRHYVAGEQIIPRKDRIKLAQVIGCDIQDLAPQYDMPKVISGKPRAKSMQNEEIKGNPFSFTEEDGCFSFGKLKTTAIILDGDGVQAYFPTNIRTHYDPQPAIFVDEIIQVKALIQQEQEEKQQRGEPYQWNGEKYHLSRIAISREPVHERMTLGLWFQLRDHYTGLATRRCLDDSVFRKKYLSDDWSVPIVGISCSLGVDITVISSDGYVFFAQRGQHQGIHQNAFQSSVSEALSPVLDRSATGREPDLYKCAHRGISEELGMQEPLDFSLGDIQFLSLSVDTHYALYGLHGMVKVNKSAKEIINNWNAGVKDKMENKKLLAIPFTPQEVCSFVYSHEPVGWFVCTIL
jgi:transcriptional regulator with XRE-family HTH domain